MGRSASATVVYGFGIDSNEAPPAFREEYGSWNYKAALDAYPATRWSGEPMDEDSWYEMDWLENLIKGFGLEKLLTVSSMGYGEESDYAVGVARTEQTAWDYGMADLKIKEPTEAEKKAILRVAEALGYTSADVGFKLYSYYG